MTMKLPGQLSGHVAALYRHPVKGFTPEPLERVGLTAGDYFPCDRLYAVEDGPSGFDPTAPAHISKQKFTVLAKIAEVARARTTYDETSGVISVKAEGRPDLNACLFEPDGREAFAAWLGDFLGEAAAGPLQVLTGPGGHRFMDHPRGFVSILNLVSVRDLERRLGRPVDALRFRANVHIEGWPAWCENDLVGRSLRLGESEARVFKPITRCAATEVDPDTGLRDIHMTRELYDQYRHVLCGVYVEVTHTGALAVGDPVNLCAELAA
jgi:uncharacterized protein YcbX